MYNKKLFIGIVICLVLIFLVSVAYLALSSKKKEPENNYPSVSPTAQPTVTKYPFASPTVSVVPAQEQKQINDTTVNNIQTAIEKSDIGTKGIRVFGYYAVVTVFSKSGVTDDANVILKNENGNWTIIAGPGTSFDQDYLNSLNLPPEVAKEANNIL